MKKLSKLLFILIILVVNILSGVSTIFAIDTATSVQNPHKEVNGKLYLLNQETGRYLPENDVQQKFAKITANTARDVKFEKAFSKSKEQFKKTISSSTPPPPGGVGYGAFYTDEFKKSYTNASAIAYDIICPTKAGGNVSTYLYLTTTNRTAKGVEALISYFGQNDLKFQVYDWAQPEASRWQVNVACSNLGDYLHQKIIRDGSYQVISIQNSTELVSGNTWRNTVWLQNFRLNTYDLVYSYEYTSSVAEQQGNYVGSWGPIIETFQDNYSYTNVLGFDHTYLGGVNSAGNWSGWSLLSSAQSDIRNDNQGLSLIFSDPNNSFAVH